MYQKLRDQFPQHQKLINPLSKMVTDRYKIVVEFTPSLTDDITSLLRRGQCYHPTTTDFLLSPGPVDAWVQSYMGTEYTEPARQLYQRMRDQQVAFRHEYRYLSVYLHTLDQAQEWIQWASDIQDTYKFHFLRKVRAVDQSTLVGEVIVKQAALKPYQYKILLNDQDMEQGSADRMRSVIKNFTGDLRGNFTLNRFLGKRTNGYASANSFYNATFYAKDDAVIMFLGLSYPKLIKKIYRVKYLGK